MLLFWKDIAGDNYTALLNYVSDFCDALTLKIPNYTKTVDGTKDFYGRDDIIIKHYNDASEKTEKLFEKLIEKRIYDTHYISSVCGYENKIYVVKLNSETLKKLLSKNSLFSWGLQSWPEDLCLFKNGKCWLETVAHEKSGYIYDNSEETKALLREMNVEFDEYPPLDDNEIPRLPL